MTPTRGTLGDLSARAFLGLLTAQGASGTLFFGHAEASTLMVLRRGKPQAQTDLGEAFDIDRSGAMFSFWPHTDAYIMPTLPSRYAASGGPLGALPALFERPLFSTAETELRGLVERLQLERFQGALVLDTPTAHGLLLFQEGRLGGAAYEEVAPTGAVRVSGGTGKGSRSGSAALLTLAQLPSASLTLHALPEPVVSSLMGWLLGLQVSESPGGESRTEARNGAPNTFTPTGFKPTGFDGVPEGFSGLEVTPVGVRYYQGGSAYLHLPYPEAQRVHAAPVTTLFAACRRAVSLVLPSEPHGWEGRRYSLTLRGRDALNPLTELAMRFRGEFGRAGQETLEQFRGDVSVETAATALSLELAELKPTVERLHTEGFLRTVSESSPTPLR